MPRSIRIGEKPASANTNAANNPAGPAPIISGGAVSSSSPVCGSVYVLGFTMLTDAFFAFFTIPFSFSQDTCTEYTRNNSGFLRASIDFFAILYVNF